ncbi:MAG: amidohydrolase family protein [Streptosporangiaceae bacterium]
MIDDHVHPFPLRATPFDPATITLDVSDDSGADERRHALAPGRLSIELLTVRLSRLLGCSPEEVAGVRDAAAAAEWRAYVRLLFDDAEIAGMVMDAAWRPDEAQPIVESVAEYAGLAGRPVWEMVRIDPLVDGLIEAGATAPEILDAVERLVTDAAVRGAVALKTVLAYRTGLAVDPSADISTAGRSLDPALPVRRRGKALRDLVLRRTLGQAAEFGLPLQVHTGFGDSDIRLAEANPLHLEEVLRTPEGRAASVVLIHGSFPWHEEVAYLASVQPRVWVEASEFNLFAPLTTADRLLRILDVAPRDRVLLGSDGHGAPETHWFGCRVLLDAWPTVAERLAAAGARATWVEETRRLVFEDNARALYRLEPDVR